MSVQLEPRNIRFSSNNCLHLTVSAALTTPANFSFYFSGLNLFSSWIVLCIKFLLESGSAVCEHVAAWIRLNVARVGTCTKSGVAILQLVWIQCCEVRLRTRAPGPDTCLQPQALVSLSGSRRQLKLTTRQMVSSPHGITPPPFPSLASSSLSLRGIYIPSTPAPAVQHHPNQFPWNLNVECGEMAALDPMSLYSKFPLFTFPVALVRPFPPLTWQTLAKCHAVLEAYDLPGRQPDRGLCRELHAKIRQFPSVTLYPLCLTLDCCPLPE